jgi:GR25 family glycosyltransferase involved in LPS biosynthesis
MIDFYVINLDQEASRWKNCELQARKYALDLTRVSAISITDLPQKHESFVSSGVRAVWLSHMKCLELFLATDASHALILEDDFQIEDSKKLHSCLESQSILAYDLVQFGFLKPGPDIALRVKVANFETALFRFVARLGNLPNFKEASFRNRLRVKEAREMPRGFTADDFQPGAHCYLISRRLARSVLKLNSPQFLCIDDFFTALSQMRTFKSIRIRKSIVSQAPFPKWSGERFVQI